MQQKEIEQFSEHKTFLADIANEIIKDNDILGTNGVKEIIVMYLLIPYITRDTLKIPNEKECIIPNLNGVFLQNIKIKDLRDSLCHSLASVDENGNFIFIDDRALYSRQVNNKADDSKACKIPVEAARIRLKSLINQIRNSI